MSSDQIRSSKTIPDESRIRDFTIHGSVLELGASSISGNVVQQPIPEAWKHLNASIAPFSIEKCRDLK